MKGNKEKSKKGIAYLIEFHDKFQKREMNSNITIIQQRNQQVMSRRRALSPKVKHTYIALSNVNFHNDRYQEQPINLKMKLIRAYVNSKENSSKKIWDDDWLKLKIDSGEELRSKKELLQSILK